jgi:hypothetical protein
LSKYTSREKVPPLHSTQYRVAKEILDMFRISKKKKINSPLQEIINQQDDVSVKIPTKLF